MSKKTMEANAMPRISAAPKQLMAVDPAGQAGLAFPAEVLKALYMTQCSPDIDAQFTPGLYHVDDASTGTFPRGLKERYRWGMLEVIRRNTDAYQRLTAVGYIAVRMGSVPKGTWGEWREMQLPLAT